MLSSVCTPVAPPVHLHAHQWQRRCAGGGRRLHHAASCHSRDRSLRRAASLAPRATQSPVAPPLKSQPPPVPPSGGGPDSARLLFRRAKRALANLQLALGEMAVLAGLSGVGTIIEQNKARESRVAGRACGSGGPLLLYRGSC